MYASSTRVEGRPFVPSKHEPIARDTAEGGPGRDLGRVVPPQVHLRQPSPSVLAAFDKVIVTARDPIDRLISAFNWRHPGHNSGSLRYGEDEGKLYRCFPDVQAFARAVTHHHMPSDVSPACYLLAKAFLTNAAHSDTSHIGRGLAYYLGPVLHDLLEKKSVFVIRSEACDRDSEAAVRRVPCVK